MLSDVAHVSHAFASLLELCKAFPETRERNLADRAFDAFNTFSEAIQAVAKPQTSQDVSDEDTEDIEAQIEAELNAATTEGYSQELYSSDEAHQAAMSIAPGAATGSALPFGAQQPIMQTFDTNSFLQVSTPSLSQDATSQDATSQVATSQVATSQDATSQVATSQDATSQDATSQVNQASSHGQADCFTGGPVVVPSQSTRKLVKEPTPEQERHANILREVTMCRESDLSIS
jgi:hypothetical protein